MIDLSSFKLLKEDNDNYEVGHPNGKKLSVSKKGLSEKAHKAIQALKGKQKFEDGGSVLDDYEDDYVTKKQPELQASAPIMTQQDVELPIEQRVTSESFGPSVSSMIQTPEQLQSEKLMKEAPPQIPSQAQSNQVASSGMEQALEMQKQANQLQYQAATQGAAAQNKAINETLAQVENLPKFDMIFKEHEKKDAELFKKLQSQEIDPDRYWKNQSTGTKISSAIGLILAGLGAGSSNGRNLVAESIDKSINDDINAQMNDQSKTMNLYKMNREHMQDEMQARLATQNQLYTTLQYKLQQAQNSAATPQAKANLMMANSLVDQQIAQNRLKLSLMQDQGTDPAMKVPYLVPPGQQDKAFTALDSAQFVGKNQAELLKNFDQSAHEVGGFSPVQATKELVKSNVYNDKMMALMAPILKDELGRPNPLAYKSVEHLMPHPFDSEERIKEKRQGLIEFMNAKSTAGSSMLKSYGINLGQYQKSMQAPKYQPGDVVNVKGKMYQVGKDGNSLMPVK